MVGTPAVFGVTFAAMGSRCEVRLDAPDEAQARRLAQFAIDEVLRIEAKYSRYRPDSIVSQVNAAAGQSWVAHDAETAALFDYARTLFDASGGLFDITSGVLRRAWDFSKGVVPAAADLQAVLARVGWGKVQRSGNSIFLPQPGMEIDFGGFGKEYAADRAAGCLVAQGVRHGYVNLGGDMRFLGPQPDGRPWMIGIQDPRHDDGTIASLPVAGGALATSGDYERFFESGGRRHCHILDPGSGEPVTYWRSVSVHAPLAIAAGSYATIAMLKQADALEFLDAAGVAYLAVDADGILHSRDLAAS
jgi:FAD:protein FMN transferase